MNIAIEIGPLLTASGWFGDKSGVYRYMYDLIDELSTTLKEKDKNAKIILFSFNRDLLKFPINPEILRLLSYSNITIIDTIPSLPSKDLFDIRLFKIPAVKLLLKILDNIFKFSNLYFKYRNDKRFQRYIEFLKNEFIKEKIKIVFHSETGFHPVKGFLNVITIYDLTSLLMPEFHREQTVDLQKRKIKFTEKYCEGIICISNSTKKDLLKLPGFAHKNITVIYPGLGSTFQASQNQSNKKILFSDINTILQHHKNKVIRKKYLLYYGTFEPRKNLTYLVKAFADLQKSNEIPNDYKLILMGGEGWGNIKNNIRNFVKENFPIHEKNNIIILDYLSDEYICEFIKNASAVVYPSLYEGFGLPVLESMALGTPVICSKISSLPEVGGNAVLFLDPNSFNDLREKIKHLVNTPQLRQELAKKGLEQSKRFNWNQSGNDLYNFLKSLRANA